MQRLASSSTAAAAAAASSRSKQHNHTVINHLAVAFRLRVL